ncbi:MAG TPA: MFS transporter [Chryseosolibacter sp.]|nr:MFS transporter [Chryseosolibacter sp.]
MQTEKRFSRYHIFIIVILTFLQFTIILDFMVLSPLGAFLIPGLKITPAQFGMVVSAYAFSAGASGFLAAGFADKFDRKKLLIIFYSGFILGTLLCGMAPDYNSLLIARIITGIFGGVIGSIAFAIVTDLFDYTVRGTVMGFLQMAFAGAQVLGLPIGVQLTNMFDWHSPFLMIVGISLIAFVLIIVYMRPVNEHLKLQGTGNSLDKLLRTLSRRDYINGFFATTLLATGGFMLMPFASAYSVNNLGISKYDLPVLYLVTGIFSMAAGPVIGRLTDKAGKFSVFLFGTILTMVIVLIYCNLGTTPLVLLMVISVFMFTGVSSRIISSQAMLSAVPDASDRGAFMSINSSVQQVSGGVATIIAGLIIVEAPGGKLLNYDILGFVITGVMVVTIGMIYGLHLQLKRKLQTSNEAAAALAEKPAA